MKKIILAAFILIGLTSSVQSQVMSKNVLGLRLGDNDGFGTEISYQRGFSKKNRLEVDLGWRNNNDIDAFKLVGLYQWVWAIENRFNWYAGVGGGIGSWNHHHNDFNNDSGTILLGAGDIGIEYNFKIPIQLALDFRPEIYFNSGDYPVDNYGSDIALSIRYRFK